MRVPIYRIELVREATTNYAYRELGPMNSSQRAVSVTVEITRDILANSPVEQFLIVCADTKLKPIGVHKITKGTLDASLVHPREVFTRAILNNSRSIFLVHNHPSGGLEPSSQDHEITRKMKAAGEILGITVLDHIIVGTDTYTGEFRGASLTESY